nr:hypothetical protein [Tanacetum cinerariifolium]
MIENHSMDRLLQEVLMMDLVMHTEKNDPVFHIEKTGMVILVVEIDVGGMTADVVDKVTCSSDDWQLKKVDLKSVHALTKPHLNDIYVFPDRHEVGQRAMKISSKIHEVILPSCNGYDKRDKIQAKPDKTEHKTESMEKSKVKSQQKVKPDKVKAKRNQKVKGNKVEGLNLPILQSYKSRGVKMLKAERPS